MKTIKKIKTISKLIFSTIAVLAVSGFGAVGYANEVQLPCCTEESCPTEYESPGEEKMVQTVTFKGLSVPVNVEGDRELVTMFQYNPGYREWVREIFKMPDKAKRIEILKASQTKPQIKVSCSSSSGSNTLLGPGGSYSCPENDGVFIQDELQCADPTTGPKSVVDITKVKKKSTEEIIKEAKLKMDERWRKIEEIEEKIMQNSELLEGYESRFGELRKQIGGGSSGGGDGYATQISDSEYLETLEAFEALQNLRHMKQDPYDSSREMSWGTKQLQQSKDQGFVRNFLSTVAAFTVGSGSGYGSFSNY